MSKYTTEVRFICENAAGEIQSKGYNDVNNIITKAAPVIFDFDFPIFDEAYRLPLERKILKHFYTREIGFETVGLWKLELDTRLNEIMPYYNQMYKSETLEFNPFYDVDSWNTQTGKKNESSNTSSSSTGTGHTSDQSSGNGSTTGKEKSKYSDTPQGGLTGIENDQYLTNAQIKDTTGSSTENSSGSTDSKQDASGTSKNDVNSTEDYVNHVSGKRGGHTYSAMLNEYRTTMLNIDMDVIEELNDLFMQIF